MLAPEPGKAHLSTALKWKNSGIQPADRRPNSKANKTLIMLWNFRSYAVKG